MLLYAIKYLAPAKCEANAKESAVVHLEARVLAIFWMFSKRRISSCTCVKLETNIFLVELRY